MEEDLETKFIEAINNSYEEYKERGARSTAKLKPVHSFIAQYINNILNRKEGNKYKIYSLGFNEGKEYQIDGKYYPKKEDIVVLVDENPIVVISFKFVTSNYAQNSNNYFENLLGETANIRRVNVGFAHLLILRAHTPYYDKNSGNKRGNLKKTELLTQKEIDKYVKLFEDNDYPHKPDVLGILIVDNSANKERLIKADLENLGLDPKTKKLLDTKLSVNCFFDKVYHLCRLKN